MSWIERSLEERLAQAARSGELDVPELAGRPIADLDRPRRPGWWAEQFVRRERSHDRRVDALAELARIRGRFWRCPDEDTLRRSIDDANAWIAATNDRLVPDDHVPPLEPDDIVARWRRMPR